MTPAEMIGIADGIKLASTTYKDVEQKPGLIFKSRGKWIDRSIHHKGKRIGELNFIKHPEGHAEIRGFFIDPEHQGKGHGRRALTQLMKEHGGILSDTRGGTTHAAQRAMHGALKHDKDVQFKKIKTKELRGKKFTDMEGKGSHLFYAHKGKSPVSDKDLRDIEHNSRYHRHRVHRNIQSFGGGSAAGAAGALIGSEILRRRGHHSASEAAMYLSGPAAIAGGAGAAALSNAIQRRMHKKHLRGTW